MFQCCRHCRALPFWVCHPSRFRKGPIPWNHGSLAVGLGLDLRFMVSKVTLVEISKGLFFMLKNTQV